MVDLTVENGIGYLTLNRPEVLNVLDLASVRQLTAHLTALRDRTDVRVVVTGGKGHAFCAGSDLKELAPLSPAGAAEAEREQADACALFDALPQPTIAMLHGYVLGGGIFLRSTTTSASPRPRRDSECPKSNWGGRPPGGWAGWWTLLAGQTPAGSP